MTSHNNQTQHPARPRPAETSMDQMPSMHPSLAMKVLVVLLILAALIYILATSMNIFGGFGGNSSSVKTKKYQALFLSNGQVYFGRLSQVDNKYIKLTDIYYLQVQQQVQPKDSKTTAADQQNQVSLAKLGNELHGPEDSMFVSKDQVLFFENLKDEGKVVTAIKDYQKSGK